MQDRPQVGTAATAGRIGMIAAAIAAFITLFSAHIFEYYSRVDVIALLGALTAAGCAVASLISPRRPFDVTALVCGASLVGFITPLWAESSPASTMSMLAWLLLMLSCAGLAVGLSTGRPSVDPRAAAALSGAAERMRSAAVSPATPAHASARNAGAADGSPAPGWYEDPQQDVLRWWDGRDGPRTCDRCRRRQYWSRSRRAGGGGGGAGRRSDCSAMTTKVLASLSCSACRRSSQSGHR